MEDLDLLDVVCLLGEDGLVVVAVVQLVAVGCLVEDLDMALGDGTPGVEALASDGLVALLQGGPGVGHGEDVLGPGGQPDVLVHGRVHGGGNLHVHAGGPLVEAEDDLDGSGCLLLKVGHVGNVLDKVALDDGVKVLADDENLLRKAGGGGDLHLNLLGMLPSLSRLAFSCWDAELMVE